MYSLEQKITEFNEYMDYDILNIYPGKNEYGLTFCKFSLVPISDFGRYHTFSEPLNDFYEKVSTKNDSEILLFLVEAFLTNELNTYNVYEFDSRCIVQSNLLSKIEYNKILDKKIMIGGFVYSMVDNNAYII